MSKREKRLQKIRQNPKNVSFDDLKLVLEDHGFWLDHATGSHHVFKVQVSDEERTLVVPFKQPVKSIYVKQALEMIDDLEMLQGDEDGDS
jgi:predicted RNA binding protein YcfA (HicA-like mRNA interferase family)